jgi:uncharacterized protein DUF664
MAMRKLPRAMPELRSLGHVGSSCVRLTLEMKCEGLDAEAMARRAVEPSTMSLLGLVRHLTEGSGRRSGCCWRASRRRRCIALRPIAMVTLMVRSPIPRSWRRPGTPGVEVEFAERFMVQAPSLDITESDPLNQHGSGGGAISLRELLVGTIEEYARHLGHADLLRERIDGRLGQ